MQSQASIKKSLKIDLNDSVKGRHLGGSAKLNFHNNVTDASWMNEALAYRLYRDAGIPAPLTTYSKVYVTVPGMYEKKYFGLYSMIENLDKDWAKEQFKSKQTGLNPAHLHLQGRRRRTTVV